MDVAELGMLLESIDVGAVSQDEFEEAASSSKDLKLEDDQRLLLYGLYKQSIVGDVNVAKPWAIQIVETAKWNAWKQFEGFPQATAKAAYVYIVNQLCSGVDTGFSRADASGAFDGVGASVSTMIQSGEDEKWTENERIFEATVENDIEKLKSCVSSGSDINMRNDEGLTALHFAADRGFLEMARLLVEAGADVAALDEDEQTPLDYAVLCEQHEVAAYLRSISGGAIEPSK